MIFFYAIVAVPVMMIAVMSFMVLGIIFDRYSVFVCLYKLPGHPPLYLPTATHAFLWTANLHARFIEYHGSTAFAIASPRGSYGRI